MKTWAKVVLGIFGVIILLGLIGGGASSKDTGNATKTASQDVSAQKSISLMYNATLKDSVNYSISGMKYNSKPDAGKVYLQVDMAIKNKGYDKFNVNPFYFQVIVDNVKYDADVTSFSIENSLETVEIMNNGAMSGSLLFQLPKSTSSAQVTLVYEGYCDGFEKCNIVYN